MEAASPARLYASVAGALLLVLGILGFFYSASFGGPGHVGSALGALRVNAWLNLLRIATGALGLLLAGYASRPYALAVGGLFTVLAIWGFTLSGEAAILGFLPAGPGENGLNLAIGLLGLLAAAGTPQPLRGSKPTGAGQKEPRNAGDDGQREPRESSEARAEAAG